MSKRETKTLLAVIKMLIDKLAPKERLNPTRCMGCGKVGYNDYETCLCAVCLRSKNG